MAKLIKLGNDIVVRIMVIPEEFSSKLESGRVEHADALYFNFGGVYTDTYKQKGSS